MRRLKNLKKYSEHAEKKEWFQIAQDFCKTITFSCNKRCHEVTEVFYIQNFKFYETIALSEINFHVSQLSDPL